MPFYKTNVTFLKSWKIYSAHEKNKPAGYWLDTGSVLFGNQTMRKASINMFSVFPNPPTVQSACLTSLNVRSNRISHSSMIAECEQMLYIETIGCSTKVNTTKTYIHINSIWERFWMGDIATWRKSLWRVCTFNDFTLKPFFSGIGSIEISFV